MTTLYPPCVRFKPLVTPGSLGISWVQGGVRSDDDALSTLCPFKTDEGDSGSHGYPGIQGVGRMTTASTLCPFKTDGDSSSHRYLSGIQGGIRSDDDALYTLALQNH
ncbi:hypothetical protein AVEN_173562-1 [Araneus ventricosus]|uniref:Uncharacterized protein n=1 Tax=Araneus ventricosus TaxID=182803 RepID=A0A4Y2UZZ7_ARAVE|nr:hypothetical protein AVEN_173562-1 [Araneus ventricosus]